MEALIYYINFKNFELDDIRLEIKRLQSEPETTLVELLGAETPALLETVEQDDDKTKSVRGRRLTIGFNSNDTNPYANADNFAEDLVDYQGKVITDSLTSPFIGNMVKEDITEAFQPRPNPVFLRFGDGFGALKGIELTESDGDVPRGYFRLIDYVYLCLRNVNFDELPVFVAFNLYELDTDPVTSNAFWDQMLDAITFETDVNKRDDCYTVLEKILDALGCFITFNDSAYYIIRWDEWDDSTGSVTTLRFAEFSMVDSVGPAFEGYSTIDVDKIIVQDQNPEYDGHYLSFDSAQKRFQQYYNAVRHIYKYEQPKELPCNSAFLRGELSATQPVDPLKKNYDYECWTMYKGVPPTTNNGKSYIRVVENTVGYETDRFILFEVQPDFTTTYLIESEPILVNQYDRIKVSVDVKHDGQIETADNGFSEVVMIVRLHANDSTYWKLDGGALDRDGGTWVASDSTFFTGANSSIDRIFNGLDDDTVYSNVGLIGVEYSDPMPQGGYITIVLMQSYKVDEFETHFSNLKVELIPLINGVYGQVIGQQTQVGFTGPKIIEKQMYIGESPHPVFKGALKKFVGGEYVLTESWQNYLDIFVLSDIGGTLARFIGYQWWNTFKRTRTVIESDIQGLTDVVPSQINRWMIKHGNQEDKYFMLTSFNGMDFKTCGWRGVFVETSYGAGDRSYSGATDPTFLNFKYLR